MLIAFDLDDTLVSEMNYVRSAYHAIARRYGEQFLEKMMQASCPADAFEIVNAPIDKILKIYRTHIPDIHLPPEAEAVLKLLADSGHILALITDGRSVTQRHKIDSLGLVRFIPEQNILISEETGADKLSGIPFAMLEKQCPEEKVRIYVGDNPAKDFLQPNLKGWHTVCLLDNGENIHPQQFESIEPEKRPSVLIKSLTELPGLVNSLARVTI